MRGFPRRGGAFRAPDPALRSPGKGLVVRGPRPGDRRGVMVKLTDRGTALFREIFPAQLEFLRPGFERALGPREMRQLRKLLTRLKESFEEMET